MKAGFADLNIIFIPCHCRFNLSIQSFAFNKATRFVYIGFSPMTRFAFLNIFNFARGRKLCIDNFSVSDFSERATNAPKLIDSAPQLCP